MLCQREGGLAFKLKRRGDGVREEAGSQRAGRSGAGLELEPRGGMKLPPPGGDFTFSRTRRI